MRVDWTEPARSPTPPCSTPFEPPENPKVLIALFGTSESGKDSFIRKVTEQDAISQLSDYCIPGSGK